MSAAEDIVAELVELERRAPWRPQDYRAGFDAGIKQGAGRPFQSPVMENIAVELTLLRTLYPAVCTELTRCQGELGTVNRLKHEALVRVVALARELDRRAPGWDKR